MTIRRDALVIGDDLPANAAAGDGTAATGRRNALRLGLAASAFALSGAGAARAADSLTIEPAGVKIDTLQVAKSLTVSGPMKIDGKNALEFGTGISGKEGSAGKIGYQTFTTDALDIVGAGPTNTNRKIKFWAEGGATLAGNLDITGTVKAQSLVTSAGASLAAVQNAVNMLVPFGTIMAYAGDTSNNGVVEALRSQGWLPCDGRVYSAQDYPDLAKVIGNSFGSLRVPDLRGRFLRGTDQGAKRDPDAGSRRAENGGNTGDKVGSLQDDEFRQHTHQYTVFPGQRGGIASGDYWKDGGAQTGPAGGNETRPKNVYVNWIIKAKQLPTSA